MGFFGKLTGFDKFKAQQNALYMNNWLASASVAQKREVAAKAIEILSMKMLGHHPAMITELMSVIPRGVQMQFLANAAIALSIPVGIRNAIWTQVPDPTTTMDWFPTKEMLFTISSTHSTFKLTLSWPGNEEHVDFAEMGLESKALDAHRALVARAKAA